MQQNNSELLYLDASTPISDMEISKDKKGIEPHRQVCLTFSLYGAFPQAPYQIRLSIKKEGEQPQMIGYTAPHYCAGQNPTIIFNLNFIIDYFFEKTQTLYVSLARGNEVANAMETTLGTVLKSLNSSKYLDLPGCQEKILVTAHELQNSNKIINMDVKIENVSQPIFFVLKKSKYEAAAGMPKEFVACYKSEVSINGTFKPVKIPSSHLDYGNHMRSVVIEMYDQGVLHGSKETTVYELLNNGQLFNLNIGKFSLFIKTSEETKKTKSFIELLNSNLNLNLEIGIDFTGSNGHYLDVDTLHYIPPEPGKKTLYENAIYECGKILEAYDSDKQYPVFGFGACPPGSKEVNHCFPLNLAVDGDPNIKGLDNVLKIYRANMPQLTFSGPTYFAPMLNMMFSIISSIRDQNPLAYHVILLLTDGMINDLDETVECIVNACDLPVSLVIVGVGDADFTEMEFLDCDNGYLKSEMSGKCSTRDLVQFVEYNKVGNNAIVLAEKVLEELPAQVEQYFNKAH